MVSEQAMTSMSQHRILFSRENRAKPEDEICSPHQDYSFRLFGSRTRLSVTNF